MNSTDSASRNAADRLAVQAETNPDLKQRLIAAGRLKGAAAGNAQPAATPTQDTTDNAPAPEVITPPKSLKENIDYTVRSTPGLPKDSAEVIHKVLKEPLLSNEKPLYQAVAAVESGGNRITKPTGTSTASGLMQLTNPTAKSLKVDSSNPEQNVKGGKALLDSLLDKYNNAEVPTLMAYNLGPAVVDAAANAAGSYEYSDLVNGIAYLKNHGYFPKILTPGNIKAGLAYPAKVLAYKQAFESISNA